MKSTLTRYVILSLFLTNQVIVTSAVVTNRQLLLGSVIGASLLVPYVYEYNFLTPEVVALLTAGVLLATIPTRTTSVVLTATTTIPTTTTGQPTCTASGYKYDPAAVCYLVVVRGISIPDAKQECIDDGGNLLLVNSKAEGVVLTAELKAKGIIGALVQGSRSSGTDPWKDDNGNPVPYLGSVVLNDVPKNTQLGYVQDDRFIATDPTLKSISAKSGIWKGHYTQNNTRYPFTMQLFLGNFDGSVKGEGTDGIGNFMINGTWDRFSGSVQFMKQYVGAHGVKYNGRISNDGTKIDGTYDVDGSTGTFHMDTQ